jgi:hypothetical protein
MDRKVSSIRNVIAQLDTLQSAIEGEAIDPADALSLKMYV